VQLRDYQQHLATLPYGKRLPTALYVHRNTDTDLGPELQQLLSTLAARHQLGPEFNVLKFRTDELKISFLCYPDFLDDAHPALRHAVTIDLVSGRVRHTDYAGNPNPPILHRKEQFLPPDHPRRVEFAALTAAEEAAGLYHDTTTIGFKLNWERLLAQKGLVIVGHHLRPTDAGTESAADPAPVILRHKTAMTRYELSKPVKTLLE
jgi:DNA phosphorothioation-associated putative methyltransferase